MDKRFGFVVRIKKLFGKEVTIDEVGMESHLFEHSDIDPSVIPSEHLQLLPDPVRFETYVYIDPEGKEWITSMGYDPMTHRLVYEVWMQDGKTVAYELYGVTE